MPDVFVVKIPLELILKYGKVFDYFDDWIVVKANYNSTKAEEIIVHKNEEKHIETNLW